MSRQHPASPDAREWLRRLANLGARGIAVGAPIEIFPSSRKETNTMSRTTTTTTESELDPKEAQAALDAIDKILAKVLPKDPEERLEAIGQLENAVKPPEPEEKAPKAPKAPPEPAARLSQRELATCKKYGVTPAEYARQRNAIRAKSPGRRV